MVILCPECQYIGITTTITISTPNFLQIRANICDKHISWLEFS